MENDNLSKIRDLMLARVRGQGGTLGTLLNQWQGAQVGSDRSVMDSYHPPAPQQGYVNTEEPLGPPSFLGGLLSLDPTDYVGPNTLAKLAAGAKGLLSGAALMPMVGVVKDSGERIVGAAFKELPSGRVVSTGRIHLRNNLPDDWNVYDDVSGFVTDKGRFLDREEAMKFVGGSNGRLMSEQLGSGDKKYRPKDFYGIDLKSTEN